MDSEAVVQDILKHHGVKGMHWGVRRARGHGSSEVRVKTGKNFLGKASIKTEGGHGLEAHPDSVAARIVQQKLKSSGKHALSNEEINALLTRTDLERRLARAPAHGANYEDGKKQVQQFLKSDEGRQSIKLAKAAATHPRVKRAVATAATTAVLATR